MFFVINDELHTPIADRFLNGITRQTIISLAKDRGYKVIERRIKPEELANVQDCFLTGTAAEITRVNSIETKDKKTKYQFSCHDITTNLMADYSKAIGR